MTDLETVESSADESRQPPAAVREPTRAEIRERAYHRYVERGRIDGFDREDWCLAERELRGGEGEARSQARVRRNRSGHVG